MRKTNKLWKKIDNCFGVKFYSNDLRTGRSFLVGAYDLSKAKDMFDYFKKYGLRIKCIGFRKGYLKFRVMYDGYPYPYTL